MIAFTDYTDLFQLRRSIEAEQHFVDAEEDAIRARTVVGGFCHLCGRHTDLTVNGGPDFGAGYPNFREGLVCQCGSKSRDRLLMLGSRDRLATARQVVFFGALSGWARWARRLYGDRILFCEYFGSDASAGRNLEVEGLTVQHEDMTQMSLPNDSSDLILHQDVLEHIPDYKLALKETLRVLRPGGQTIFTAPFFHALDETFVRAGFDQFGGLVHHAEPELHGDPLVPEGILAFYNFGWSLIDDMRAVGFEDVKLRMLYRPDLGIVSNGCPHPPGRMLPVFLTGTKPSL